MSAAEPIIDAGLVCGESPVWLAEEGALYLTDIPSRMIHRFGPDTGGHESWPMPEEVGCFAFRESGGLVAALRSGFAFVDLDSANVDYLCDPEADRPENRFNDGRCDRQGRFWAGTMHEPRTAHDGKLYCLDGDRHCREMADNVLVANGLAWSPDGTVMYWSDSRNSIVFAFDFDPVSGAIEDRRTFIELTEAQGRPDGAAIDAEGFYWSACYMGGRVLRISPEGKIDREILLPVRDVTMVAFGGSDLDRLFITTSKEALSDAERRQTPLAGCVFEADPGVRGLPEPKYRG